MIRLMLENIAGRIMSLKKQGTTGEEVYQLIADFNENKTHIRTEKDENHSFIYE